VFESDGTSGLQVNKTFTQANFESFPDPRLHVSNVQIAGVASTRIHANGYILGATVEQVFSNCPVSFFSSCADFFCVSFQRTWCL
jgi:hypothetical protein